MIFKFLQFNQFWSSIFAMLGRFRPEMRSGLWGERNNPDGLPLRTVPTASLVKINFNRLELASLNKVDMPPAKPVEKGSVIRPCPPPAPIPAACCMRSNGPNPVKIRITSGSVSPETEQSKKFRASRLEPG